MAKHHFWLAFLAAFLVTFVGVGAQPAQAQIGLPGAELNVPATLVSEHQTVRPGQTVTLAFVMKPKPTWHGYWENPGDAGIGMSFDWTLPKAVTAGNARYPVPETLLVSGIMNYVYEGEYAVLVDLKIGEDIPEGVLPISVRSDWLACTEEICVPEGDTLSINLNISSDADMRANSTFNGYRAALPRPLGSKATYQVTNDRFRLSIPYPADQKLEEAYFFILQDGVVDYGKPQNVTRDGDTVFIETAARGSGEGKISGIFKIAPHEGFSLDAVSGPVEISGNAVGAGTAQESGGSNWWLMITALGGAIIGGLLLNLMPCVFPILSLKAISLAKAGGEEKSVRRDALAYTAGVIVVASALGALLLALRASGAAVGWAFQLQDPRVIFVLLALVTAIAFNLAGLFELPTFSGGSKLAEKSGPAGSFWTGALAAFVATPCTGPFMAAALGATIVLPPIAALIIFAGLGLGLALPFLLIAYVPAIRSKLPKPGAWLDGFRKAMSVPMFLTAIALIWLLARQIGSDGLGIALVLLMTAMLFLWWFGSGQMKGASRGLATTAALTASVAAAIFLIPSYVASSSGGAQKLAAATLPSEPYSEARLSELRSAGQPVFAYFTADWCITCKANEASSIQRQETADAFKAADIAVLVGDWTTPDPAISQFLESHGRAGVPLYVYYAPGADAVILPQILTPDMLVGLTRES